MQPVDAEKQNGRSIRSSLAKKWMNFKSTLRKRILSNAFWSFTSLANDYWLNSTTVCGQF